jgi:hypothetical protein
MFDTSSYDISLMHSRIETDSIATSPFVKVDGAWMLLRHFPFRSPRRARGAVANYTRYAMGSLVVWPIRWPNLAKEFWLLNFPCHPMSADAWMGYFPFSSLVFPMISRARLSFRISFVTLILATLSSLSTEVQLLLNIFKVRPRQPCSTVVGAFLDRPILCMAATNLRFSVYVESLSKVRGARDPASVGSSTSGSVARSRSIQ